MKKAILICMCAILLGVCVPALPLLLEKDKQPAPTAFMPEITEPATQAAIPVTEADFGDGKLEVSVLLEDGTVTPLALDDYLTGVLLAEMPASFEIDALKAQAVVARTITLRSKKHDNCRICANPACCQGYISVASYLEKAGQNAMENVEKAQKAVSDTDLEVLLYDGALIDATYFSCSGGKTEAAVAVWGSDVPYLQSVDSPGEEIAVHYTDEVVYTCQEFAAKLVVENAAADFSGEPAAWFGEVTRTEGGGVETAVLGKVSYSGTALRRVLKLRSTAFTMTTDGQNVTITTQGYGHRVGMSQYGAEAMALSGSTYQEILAHYYAGTVLSVYKD